MFDCNGFDARGKKIDYGTCDNCGTGLKPVWFKEVEEEYYRGNPTGAYRERKAVSYLICPNCLKEFCVDDSFDEPWQYC